MEESAAPPDGVTSTGKVRILLQSGTHLVPGGDRQEKLAFIQNLVCQHHWKRDYDSTQDRFFSYRDDFSLENRKCFFLIDHHGHDHTVPREKVPVLWYKWTGESLVRFNEDLPSKMQEELKKWPFAWEGQKVHRVPRRSRREGYSKVRRRVIKERLDLGKSIMNDEVEFLREHPEHAQWLKTNMDRELWVRIEPSCELPSAEE